MNYMKVKRKRKVEDLNSNGKKRKIKVKTWRKDENGIRRKFNRREKLKNL